MALWDSLIIQRQTEHRVASLYAFLTHLNSLSPLLRTFDVNQRIASCPGLGEQGLRAAPRRAGERRSALLSGRVERLD